VRTAPAMVWNKKELIAEEVRTLAARYDLGLLEASILLRRGIADGESLLSYLEDDLRFAPNPYLFGDMEDVVDRLTGARDDEEAVLVFGDRDADGITSTVILVEGFQELGLKVEWRVPQGDAAYGLTLEAVETFAEAGGGLIVTIDCGISNVKEIERARQLGTTPRSPVRATRSPAWPPARWPARSCGRSGSPPRPCTTRGCACSTAARSRMACWSRPCVWST